MVEVGRFIFKVGAVYPNRSPAIEVNRPYLC